MLRTAGNILNILAVVIIVGAIVTKACTFVIHEREQAVITRLAKPIHVIVGDMPDEQYEEIRQAILQTAARSDEEVDTESLKVSRGAGLYFKLPFADTVERFPDVLKTYDAESEAVVLADKKTLIVDNFARWRIENPLLFRISVRTTAAATGALDDVIYSAVREELGQNDLTEVIRTTNEYVDRPMETQGEDLEDLENLVMANPMKEHIDQGREKIMNAVTAQADARARTQYGIRVVDVRIKRADLLPENFEAVYGRMQAERSRISKAYRSEGQKQADIIEGTTDRRVQVILANAERDAAKLRGEGDAGAIRIFAEAFGANPDLYVFMRSLEVMEESTPPGSEMLIGLDSGLYKLLKTDVMR
jgi:membrane protease subunit HflC